MNSILSRCTILVLCSLSFAHSINFKSITFAPTICGEKADIQPLSRVWYKSLIGTHNLQDWFTACSYGKVNFNRQLNIISQIPIYIACNGSGWRWPSCTGALDWHLHEQTYRKAIDLGFSANDVRINIIKPHFTPNTCTYAGLATLPCSPGRCATWFNIQNTSHTTSILALAVHEFGHTFGLKHTTDPTDPMGSGFNMPLCFAAPSSAILGWSTPILTILVNARYTFGMWHNSTLPPLAIMSRNHVQILSNSNDTETQTTFISYRTNIGYDAGLSATFQNKLHIHFAGSGTLITQGVHITNTYKNIEGLIIFVRTGGINIYGMQLSIRVQKIE